MTSRCEIELIITAWMAIALNLVRSSQNPSGFPALASMQLFTSFKSVTICSVVIAIVCATLGIVVSIVASTPVGATIVVINMLAFGLCWLLGMTRS